ncbi:MAG TPA: hydroxyacid dehydrogenase [Candidatus Saccharimonadales bacterium]|nr:hydroxyacid dehydrogenase [Candidatus Saccharimonadales bacterium]
MSARVLVSDAVAPATLEALKAAGLEVNYLPKHTPEELRAAVPEAEGWIVRSATKATAELIEAAPKLRAIGRAGAGVDNVDVAAATRRGVLVMNVPGGSTLAVAELTFALLLALVRHVSRAHASLREGRWEKSAFLGTQLSGKTLGLVGVGRIGRAVAARAQAFGMQVLGCDPKLAGSPPPPGVEWVELDALLTRADVVSLHVPLSPQTRGLIGAAQFARMKPGALLVDCARGGVVDEAALAEALRSGRLAGAALDVFETEPPPAGHPLLGLPNVVATPHLGASTVEAQEGVGVTIAAQLADALLGRGVRDAVNPEAWKRSS